MHKFEKTLKKNILKKYNTEIYLARDMYERCAGGEHGNETLDSVGRNKFIQVAQKPSTSQAALRPMPSNPLAPEFSFKF
jgi:hypothetical protein